MDLDLYDEFGNYVGPDIADEEDEEADREEIQEDDLDDDQAENGLEDNRMQVSHAIDMDDDDEPRNQIVLHEDKKYYPSAQEIYGPDVEVTQ